jgi:predicted secreted protein
MHALRLASLCFVGLSSIAHAGDASDLRVLGFSTDATIFAFEESGIQDGSGFPYVNRFYINTEFDSYVEGTPIRTRLEDENASLADARDIARAAGETASKVTDLQLASNPGQLLAFAPLTEIGGNPLRLEFHVSGVYQEMRPGRVLNMNVHLEPPAENCYGMAEQQASFDLSMSDKANTYGEPVTLHQDNVVPKSRNCPTGYRIGGVVRHTGPGGPILVVLINVQSIGFEGPDHRWIAVVQPDPWP